MTDSSRSRRRLLLRVALLLVLVVLAAWATWDYLGTRELNRLVREARAANEPLTVEDAERFLRLDEDRGAAPLYLAAASLVDVEWKAFRAAAERLDDVGRAWPPRPLTADEAALAQRVVAHNALALEMVDRAASMPFRAFPPGTDYSYRWAQLHESAFAAALRSRLLALGESLPATASLVAQVNQLRTCWNEGGIAYQTVMAEGLRDAARSLGWLLERSNPGEDELTRLDAALARLEDDSEFSRGILAYRAATVEHWLRYLGPLPQSSRRDAGAPGLLAWLARPYIRDQVNDRLQVFREVLRVSGLRPGDRVLEALDHRDASERRSHWVPISAREILGLSGASAAVFFESQALVRSARAAIAVERYRRTNGTLPASLDEVRLADGKPLPPDPITGKPLRFSAGPDGYVIYGIGSDRKDDGGKVTAPKWGPRKPAPFGPIAAPDWGVRVRSRAGAEAPAKRRD